MPAQRNEDYVLRQVRAVAAMLARIIGLRLEGKTDEARGQLEEAFGALLEERNHFIRRLDSSTAAALLRKPASILMYARLIHEEAILGHASAVRAAELTIEVLRRDPHDWNAQAFLRELTASIGIDRLSHSYQGDARALLSEPDRT